VSEGDVLQGREIRVCYGERTAVSIERITLREGEILALLGPNGSGKSTLLRVLAMLQVPTAGRVRYRNWSGRQAEAHLRRGSGAVLQRPHLWVGNVRSNLELGLKLARIPARERQSRTLAAARQLGIESLLDAQVATLSGGEWQRVAIARALALQPDVLFLDEPTANLDAEVNRALREDVERIARCGTTSTLLVTHDRREAFALADRIAVLLKGNLVQVGTPTELYEHPANPYIAKMTGAEFSLRGSVVGCEQGILLVRVGGTLLRATGEATEGQIANIGYRPEDVFLSQTGAVAGSARNRLQMRVLETRESGGLVRVRLGGPPELVAVVTRAAARELQLEPGAEITARLKASALHAFPL